MPLRITPSKAPLPTGKRSSLRNKSYEVEPASGRKVYPSLGFPPVVRPPPISDDEAALFHSSRLVSLYNSAQCSHTLYVPYGFGHTVHRFGTGLACFQFSEIGRASCRERVSSPV